MSIEKLRAAYAAATPRTWEVLMTAGVPHVACLTESGVDVQTVAACGTRTDAEFIAVAWQMMPQLLLAVAFLKEVTQVLTTPEDFDEDARRDTRVDAGVFLEALEAMEEA